jgi:uncharacterized membrane protein YdjX (TVP38/TMEM64 family)
VEPATLETKPQPTALRRTAPIALFATIVPITGNLAMLAAAPFLVNALRGTGFDGAISFVIAYALLGSIAIAPTYTTSIVAGLSFGVLLGFSAVLIGTVIGGTLCFLIARRVGAHRVIEAFRDHERLDTVRRALVEDDAIKTLWIVFLLRLSPILPFGTTNILLATSGVRLPVFVCGTLLGMIPRIGAIFFAAAGANQLDFKSQASWWILAAGIVATVACIAVMALMGKRALDRATGG